MSDSAHRPAGQSVLRCRGVVKHFRQGDSTLEVLKGVDLDVTAGARLAIVGASGCGKSTLLQLMGGLERPTAGEVFVDGQRMNDLDATGRGMLRNRAIGFVYQFHHLLPEFTALENVAMPLLIRRMSAGDARAAATDMLERVGLSERLRHKPGQLSGGERQRAAVARALITSPAVVLADEPTGNLDGRTGNRVFELMLELNADLGTSLVVVTHDPHIAERMSAIYTLHDGRLLPGVHT